FSVVAALLLAASLPACATVFATVHGVVHDPGHRPVVGAEVRLQAADSDVVGGFGDESGAAYSTRCWRVYAIGGCERVGERSRYGDACNADYARDDQPDSGREPHAGHGDDYRLRTRRVYVAQHASHSRRKRDELADRWRSDSEYQDCVERGTADRSEGY